MKVLFLVLLSVAFNSLSQSKVYSDEFQNVSNLIYEVSATRITKVNSVANKVQLYSIRSNEVYIGQSNSFFDCIYTVSNNQIYKGRSTSTFDLLYTLKDGKLIKGDGNFPNRVIFTFENGKIYFGDSSSIFDLVATYELDRDEDLLLIGMILAPF